MPTQSYSFEPGGPQHLEVSWSAGWKNFALTLEGQPLGSIPDTKALRQGQEFNLPDGSILRVQLRRGLTSELHLLRNEQPLPGSASDPQLRLRLAYFVLFFIGGLNAVFGLLGMLIPARFFQQLGVGLYNLLIGLAFLVLGLFTLRRSPIALGIAFALLLIESISSLLGGFNVSLFLNLVFLIILWQGMEALRVQGGAEPNKSTRMPGNK
jgi:hypothetical protein